MNESVKLGIAIFCAIGGLGLLTEIVLVTLTNALPMKDYTFDERCRIEKMFCGNKYLKELKLISYSRLFGTYRFKRDSTKWLKQKALETERELKENE